MGPQGMWLYRFSGDQQKKFKKIKNLYLFGKKISIEAEQGHIKPMLQKCSLLEILAINCYIKYYPEFTDLYKNCSWNVNIMNVL